MSTVPNQRTSDAPQADVTVTVTVKFIAQDQRAELHVDLTDDKLRELAVHSAAPTENGSER